MTNTIRLAAVACLALLMGCGSRLDPGRVHAKHAAPHKVAAVWQPTTERPSRSEIEAVQRHGRREFVRTMKNALPAPMAIHALGWFGDLWDLHVVAPYLNSADEDTRMVALTAFSRLAGACLEDVASANAWWAANKDSIPEPADD